MKYSRFEELPVWQDAIELAVRVFALTALPVFRSFPSVRDQIERASMSISNNIAEGFERGTTQETLTFLYISRVFISHAVLLAKRDPSCACAKGCHGWAISKPRFQISEAEPRKYPANCAGGATHYRTPVFEANAT